MRVYRFETDDGERVIGRLITPEALAPLYQALGVDSSPGPSHAEAWSAVISAADLALRLARDAEAVCRHYLSNGCRSGRYWIAGDAMNTRGRSLYVRLQGPDYGPGAAGKWTDAATGEHGDLLDLIARN